MKTTYVCDTHCYIFDMKSYGYKIAVRFYFVCTDFQYNIHYKRSLFFRLHIIKLSDTIINPRGRNGFDGNHGRRISEPKTRTSIKMGPVLN